MSIRHTPGPWSWDGCGVNDATEYRERIATYSRLHSLDNPEARKANGRLMAAAPELLEILEAIVDGSWWASVEQVDDASEFDQALIVQARAAIAKAKGGA